MSKSTPIVMAFLAFFGLVALHPSDARANAAEGRKIFMAKGCFECHGTIGEGSIASGPAIAPLTMTATDVKLYVRAPTGVMPAYSLQILSDQEIESIASYLQSLPKARGAEDIQLLKAYVDADKDRKP